ncbi:MAG: hypothetical protein KDD51_02590 [Bdellovibrionales bacterium]|nr:hypothetical protein [Bdellovibrionales bacterium]
MIQEITQVLKDMPAGGSFLRFDEGGELLPQYGKQVLAVFELWQSPLLLDGKQDRLRCLAALLPHGKIHVAESFFVLADTNTYLGTGRVFRIDLPDGKYDETQDDILIDELREALLKGTSEGVG